MIKLTFSRLQIKLHLNAEHSAISHPAHVLPAVSSWQCTAYRASSCTYLINN